MQRIFTVYIIRLLKRSCAVQYVCTTVKLPDQSIVVKNVSAIPNEMREEVEIMLELFCDLEQKNMEVRVQVEDEKSVFNISDYMV